MSYGYYVEYGEPTLDTPAIRQAAALISFTNHYGALHIVVDDWNIEDHHLQWCLDHEDAKASEKQLMRMMLALTLEERASAMAIAEGYWSTATD